MNHRFFDRTGHGELVRVYDAGRYMLFIGRPPMAEGRITSAGNVNNGTTP